VKAIHKLLIVLVVVFVAGCGTGRAGREKDIAVDKLPKAVLEAARKAVPGMEIEEAEVEKTSHGLVYEVEGEADGKEYELLISADGKVLSMQTEDDDKDDAKGKPEKEENDEGEDKDDD